jgi:hypothetical protein
MDGFTSPGRANYEHHPHPVYIHVLKEGRPGAGFEDVQVFAVKVFRVGMPKMGRENQ